MGQFRPLPLRIRQTRLVVFAQIFHPEIVNVFTGFGTYLAGRDDRPALCKFCLNKKRRGRTMANIFVGPAAITITVFGIVAMIAVGCGIYWLFNKQARLRDLAELRKQLDHLKPSDPEYGAVRALYTSMVIDAERWGFFHSGSGSSDHGGSAHDGGGHHTTGDHGGGGDHH